MYYAFIKDNVINGIGQCECLNEEIQNIEITEEVYNAIIEDKDLYIWNGSEIILNPDYDDIIKKRESERILALSMTRSDFFDGMIMAFGLNNVELRVVVSNILNMLNITDIEKKIALNNYDNALNFYRKHTLFTLLSGVEIPITEQYSIIISSDQWDKFFDETNKKNPDAYKELLPINEEK